MNPRLAANLFGAAKMSCGFSFNTLAMAFADVARGDLALVNARRKKSRAKNKNRYAHCPTRETKAMTNTWKATNLIVFSSAYKVPASFFIIKKLNPPRPAFQDRPGWRMVINWVAVSALNRALPPCALWET